MLAIEAEKCVLGCVVISHSALIALDILNADDFFNQDHQEIFTAMRKLRDEKQPIDLITLDEATGKNRIGQLVDLSKQVSSAAMVEAYAKIVKSAANKRRIIRAAESMIQQAQDPTINSDEIVAYGRQQLRDIAGGTGKSVSLSDAMTRAYSDLSDASARQSRVIPYGIGMIDRLMGGIFPGELTIIGARTSVGKSAMALRVAISAAESGKRVYFVSLEMPTNQLCHRFISGNDLDMMRLRKGTLTEREWGRVTEEMARYSDTPIQLDTSIRFVEDLCSEVRTMVDAGRCDLVIVDYVQKLRTREKQAADHLRVGSIVWKLKELTLDLDIPVIALAQVKRISKDGKSRMPILEDLKDSGSIEQDADNVILLHTPNDADDECINREDKHKLPDWARIGLKYMAIDVAKQRQGATGKFNALFNPRAMTYQAIERS